MERSGGDRDSSTAQPQIANRGNRPRLAEDQTGGTTALHYRRVGRYVKVRRQRLLAIVVSVRSDQSVRHNHAAVAQPRADVRQDARLQGGREEGVQIRAGHAPVLHQHAGAMARVVCGGSMQRLEAREQSVNLIAAEEIAEQKNLARRGRHCRIDYLGHKLSAPEPAARGAVRLPLERAHVHGVELEARHHILARHQSGELGRRMVCGHDRDGGPQSRGADGKEPQCRIHGAAGRSAGRANSREFLLYQK
eukprot:scaffold11624_cov107-Isochrysis_galbana.AAC.1